MSNEIAPTAVVTPADIRVSDADREEVAGLLQDAMEHGMITLDEYGERSAIALAARTRGELVPLLADLPSVQLPVGPVVADEDRPLELRTRMGDLKQIGRWVVPSQINASCTLGDIKINFTQAVCNRKEIRLHANCGWGSIVATVPRGWRVVVESAEVGSGSLVNKATAPGESGAPVLRVWGKVTCGNIKIKYGRR